MPGAQVGLLAILPGPDELLRALALMAGNPNYSRSMIRAVQVLATLPVDGSARELAAIAKSLDLSTSTTHRYLQTWVALGVVTQDAESRRYARPTILS